jgi:hypothetical protein
MEVSMSTIRQSIVVLLLLTTATSMANAADQVKELLRFVPEHANALVRVDIQALRASPYAVRQGWSQQREAAFASGALSLPPRAQAAVMAAQIQPGGGASWMVALIAMSQQVDFAELAKREGGSIDRIGVATAVISPRRQAYFVGLLGNVVGIFQPTNRQDLARWVKFCQQNSIATPSRYLQIAVLDTSDRAQIVLAFDADEMLDAKVVKQRLAQTKTLGQKPAEIERLTPILASIKGITLRVHVGDDMTGRLRVDFGDAVIPLAPYFKPLLLEVLENLGIAIEDFDAWDVKPGTLPKNFRPGDRSISLEGALSDSGLRKLMSLVNPQSASFDDSPTANGGGTTPAAASLAYFHSVDTLLRDLKNQRAKTQKGIGAWFDKYSQKIDALPVLNVDNELLDWGQAIARNFRLLAMSLRGVDVQTSILECSKSWIYVPPTSYAGYNYSWTNAEQYGNNFGQVQDAQTNLVMQGHAARVNLWRQIDDSTAQIRRKMTQKYQIEF